MTTSAIAENAWSLDGVDEEIVEDLKALGINVSEPVTVEALDQTRRDTVASILMRRIAEELAATAQAEQSCQAEIEFVKHRYGAELAQRRDRARQLEQAVEAIAYHTKLAGGYVGKKKSRDVGAGAYGYRTYAAGPEIQDEAAYIAWAETHAPETLRVKPTMTLATAKEYLTEDELKSVRREVIAAAAKARAAAGDDVAPGLIITPEHDDFYAKPLPAAAIVGARV